MAAAGIGAPMDAARSTEKSSCAAPPELWLVGPIRARFKRQVQIIAHVQTREFSHPTGRRPSRYRPAVGCEGRPRCQRSCGATRRHRRATTGITGTTARRRLERFAPNKRSNPTAGRDLRPPVECDNTMREGRHQRMGRWIRRHATGRGVQPPAGCSGYRTRSSHPTTVRRGWPQGGRPAAECELGPSDHHCQRVGTCSTLPGFSITTTAVAATAADIAPATASPPPSQ